MTEERITRVEAPGQGVHTHTTIVIDETRRRGTSTWLVVAIIALGVLGLVIFGQMSGAEAAKDIAIADAATQVGAAAGQVGDAAQQAAVSLGE